MRQRFLPLFTAVTIAGAPSAMGQTFTGAILYQLNKPTGFAGTGFGNEGTGAVSANQTVGFGYVGNQNSLRASKNGPCCV